jgi:crotonobetainyl-CoA:carnitine CoA-transferase CaiB-like acyl-CoA transferase
MHLDHLRERGFVVEWDQPGVGVYEYGGFPIHFSDETAPDMHPAPRLGGDNRSILTELGFSQTEIDHFESSGAIFDSPPS